MKNIINSIGILFVCLLVGNMNNISAQSTVTKEIKTNIYCSHCLQCETCGMRFDAELYKLPGLKSFTVDPVKNTIKVSYNPKKVTIEKIRECIAACGYDADDIKATEAGLNSLDACCKQQK